MTYRELQQALKTMRSNGFDVRCKLNAKTAVLQAEYNRLTDANPQVAALQVPAPTQDLQVNMSYKDLRAVLRLAREKHSTNVKLNASKEVLAQEWLRLRSQAVTTNDRKFGVEIEFALEGTLDEGQSIIRIIRQLNEAGIKTLRYPGGYDTSKGKHWHFMTDGSCGYELVSPPLDVYGAESYTEIAAVMATIKRNDGYVTEACGLHVHIEAIDFSVEQIKHWLWAYSVAEPQLDQMVDASRRGNENGFCTSMRTPSLNSYALDRCKSVQDIAENITGTRYVKFNVHSYVKYGTIEIRHLQGSLDIDTLRNWVEVQLDIMRKATKVAR